MWEKPEFSTEMEGVRAGEGFPVFLQERPIKRPAIIVFVESGYISADVDLLDVIAWVKTHRPELLK